MKSNFENYQQLPDGNLLDAEVIIQTEWKVPNEQIMTESIKKIIETFNKYSLNHESTKGILSYSCFLNIDNHHIIHFTQWKNKATIQFFNENDLKERIRELLANIEVKRLGKTEFVPYKSFTGTNKKEDVGLVVFVKQYFQEKNQAENWIELILKCLQIENTKGLMNNTYYLSEDRKEILNYALWANETSYTNFLKHTNPKTSAIWDEIKNFNGLIYEKGEVKRHKKFIRIY